MKKLFVDFKMHTNKDAGQHYTPREVIELMVNILFAEDSDILSGNAIAKTIYDIIIQRLIQFNYSIDSLLLAG